MSLSIKLNTLLKSFLSRFLDIFSGLVVLFSAGCWAYTFRGLVFIFPPPHTQQYNGIRRMEEPSLIASESMPFVIQEEGVGGW